jgi:CDP-diacylglycerol--inositol 3-phosphatidyltransferase
MAGAKNRRQGAAATSPEPKGQDKEMTQGANGNGSAHVTAKNAGDANDTENIFLLWPNIIGTDSKAMDANLHHS